MIVRHNMENKNSNNREGNESQNSPQEVLHVNRRDVMKKSALLTTTGTLGLGSVGMATASSQCKNENKELSEDNNYYWDLPANKKNQESCTGSNWENKVHLGVNFAHLSTFSPENEDRWYHSFQTVGHSESKIAEPYACDGPWEPDYLLKHKATFINELTSNVNNTVSKGSDVKANPPVGSSTIDDVHLDLAYTLLASAIGGASWTAGTAMSLAAAAESNDEGAKKSDEIVEYLWDYTGTNTNPPCGTNAVYHVFRSVRGGDDDLKFTHRQEAWGDDGISDLYIGTEYQFDSTDSDTTSSSTSTASDLSTETSEKNGSQRRWPASVGRGDIIRDTEGNEVEVKTVEVDKQSVQGTAPEEVTASEISNRVAEEFGPDRRMVRRQMPAQIKVTRVIGKVVK